jgi:hypothetical protein
MARTLIAITTCNRLDEVKKYIWDYIRFCNTESNFDFLLSLDGRSKDYVDFCEKYEIPMISSDENEGVGISKNRVFTKFPDYDYYFFIEDDVELVDSKVFENHIKASELKDYPHLTLTYPRNIVREEQHKNIRYTLADFGSAHVNFFKGSALRQVGGWHDTFAKYKRYGHTEHSYRFVHAKLQPTAFIVLSDELKHMFIHNPPHVTNNSIKTNENQLIEEEQNIIDTRPESYPVSTPGHFSFNGYKFGKNQKVAEFLRENPKRYPLTKGSTRRNALAEHYFMKFSTSDSSVKKARYLLRSILHNPLSNPFKHFIKSSLRMS